MIYRVTPLIRFLERHVELIRAVVLCDSWGASSVDMSQNELSCSHPALGIVTTQKISFSRRATNMIYSFVTLTNIAADFDSPLSQEVSMGYCDVLPPLTKLSVVARA